MTHPSRWQYGVDIRRVWGIAQTYYLRRLVKYWQREAVKQARRARTLHEDERCAILDEEHAE